MRVPHWPPGDGRLLQCHQHHGGAAQDGGKSAKHWQEGVRDTEHMAVTEVYLIDCRAQIEVLSKVIYFSLANCIAKEGGGRERENHRIHLKVAEIKWIHSCNLLLKLHHLHCVMSFREGNEKSYQLLRDSLDLYLTINPDNVQYLLLQARLYFHLGIWPEKVSICNVRLGKKNFSSSHFRHQCN